MINDDIKMQIGKKIYLDHGDKYVFVVKSINECIEEGHHAYSHSPSHVELNDICRKETEMVNDMIDKGWELLQIISTESYYSKYIFRCESNDVFLKIDKGE